MGRNPEQLTCVAMVVCDDVFRDQRTNKLILVGVFNNIDAYKLPTIHPRMSVLFTVTNGRGSYEASLSVEHEASGEKIAEMSGPMSIDSPLAIVDFDICLPRLRFDRDGKYWVVLRIDGEILQQRPFQVTLRQARNEDTA